MNVLVKRCSLCGEEKTAAHFISVPQGKYGLSSRCKPCRVKKYQEWYARGGKKRVSDWGKEHRERRNAQSKSYRKKDPSKSRASQRRYMEAHPEIHRARAKRNRLSNPAAYAERGSRRRATREQASVTWADRFKVWQFYDEAMKRSKIEGIAYEVDHIVPLKHPLVCGLHNEHNLMVITAQENRAKGNRRWPGMP